MKNIKLVIEYDGTDFQGWQWQPEGRTIEGEMRNSLGRLLQETPKIYGSGRTDAGVHALGQVANFKTRSSLDLARVTPGLNHYLPPDIRVLNAEEVDEDFHARYSAKAREYVYVISRFPKAIARQYSWFCRYQLDITRMAAAAEFFRGEHVFEAFSRFREEEVHYKCIVDEVKFEERDAELLFSIRANRFLHNMVRIIVGTLIEVGRGKLSAEDISAILQSRDRNRAGSKVPAQGLFLARVFY